MKRKSARKSSRREEENSNELENNDQNGDASDHEVEEPKDKKRKPSKGGRKNVSFIKKDDETGPSEDGTSDNDHEDEIKEVETILFYTKKFCLHLSMCPV